MAVVLRNGVYMGLLFLLTSRHVLFVGVDLSFKLYTCSEVTCSIRLAGSSVNNLALAAKGNSSASLGTTDLDYTSPSTDGYVPSVRLIDYFNFVQVFQDGEWQTLCVNMGSSTQSRWTKSEGDVTCRSIGYSQGSSSTWCHGSTDGVVVNSSVLQLSITCSGDEDNYPECNVYDYDPYDYSFMDDYDCEVVSVTCSHDLDLALSMDVRLDEKNTVQSYENGYWQTWCIDTSSPSRWTIDEGNVVCRMVKNSSAFDIGTLYYESVTSVLHFGLVCKGSEKHYSDCLMNKMNSPPNSSCEVVTVHCVDEGSGALPDIRLMNGTNLVQTLHNDVWRTWCVDTSNSSRWTVKEGQVVCHMLDQGEAILVSRQPASHVFMNPVLLVEIQCLGNESYHLQCHHVVHLYQRTSNGACTAVNVTCVQGPRTDPGSYLYLKTRLSSTRNTTVKKGRIEVGYRGNWGTVCSDGWGMNETHVVCRSLGYNPVGLFYSSASLNTGNVALGDVTCKGDEESLAFCEYSGPPYSCATRQDIIVKCHDTENLEIRLVGEEGSHGEGRLEVYFQGVWGTVNNNNWDLNDAHVVCRSMGYSRAIASFFSQGTGNIVLDNVQCTGNETNLAFCDHSGLYFRNISQDQAGAEVGVTCDDQRQRIRFTSIPLGPWDPEDKMVEVYIEGDWKPVCQTWKLSSTLEVICRTVGLKLYRILRDILNNKEGVVLDCPADAMNMSQCTSSLGNCEHVVGATCLSDPPAVRLINGTGPNHGRAEVFFANKWMALSVPQSSIFSVSDLFCLEIGNQLVSVSYFDGSFGLAGTVFANWIISHNSHQRVFVKTSVKASKNEAAFGVACKNTEHGITVETSIYEESKALALVIAHDARPVCANKDYMYVAKQKSEMELMANSACEYLGYPRAVLIRQGVGWPGHFLTLIYCSGSKLNDCKFAVFDTVCDHVLELHCDIGGNMTVSLKGGEGDYDGQIELSFANGLELTGGVYGDQEESFYHTVCKSLGYEKAVYMTSNAPLGSLSNKFRIVTCPLDAADLSYCFIDNFWVDVISGRENVTTGVICNAADPLPVRLVEQDGIGTSTGEVEVRIFNEWTALRLYNLDENFVGVLCLQLEFSPYNASWKVIYDDDEGDLHAIQVECESDALDLRSCILNNKRKKTNSHPFKIHISCDPEPFNRCTLKDERYPCDASNGGCTSNGTSDVICWCKDGYTLATDGRTCIGSITKARFLKKTGPSEGIPEVFYKGDWFLVQYPYYNDDIASISIGLRITYDTLCRMLGFKEMFRISQQDVYNFQPLHRISLDTWTCSDNTISLQDCKHYPSLSTLYGSPFVYTHTLHIFCQSADIFKLRLAGSSFPNKGRIEIATNEGEWGGICTDKYAYSYNIAVAFCNQLGFSASLAEITEYQGPQGLPVFADGVTYRYYGGSFNISLSFQKKRDDCQKYVGVVCTEKGPIKTRLLPSSRTVQEGTPQVFLEKNNTWVDVCINSLTIADLFCSQQGYSGLLSLVLHSITSKYAYLHSDVYGYYIRKYPAASSCHLRILSCNNGQPLNIRLARGWAPFTGIIEIEYIGNWTSVLFYHNINNYISFFAEVTCRSLGYYEVQSFHSYFTTVDSIFGDPVCSTKDINSCQFVSMPSLLYSTTVKRRLTFVTCNEESFNPCLQKGLLYPCDPAVGGCTLLLNHTYQCTCPSDMVLDTNNKTCIVPQDSTLQVVTGFLPPELKESFESLRKSLFDDDSLANNTSSDDSDSSVSVARRLDSFLDDMLEANITDLLHIVQDDIELVALPLDAELNVRSINFGLGNTSRSSLPEISIPIAALLEGHNGSIIAGAFAVIKLKTNSTERIHHNVSDSLRSGYLNSDVVSIKLSGVNTTSLKENISISFPMAESSGSGFSPHCSFLEQNEASGSTWSLRGCSRKNVAEGVYDDVITCTCNHLTSFAILMLTNIDAAVAFGKHSFILSVVTYVGLSFSIISLVLSLIAFFISKIQTTRLFLMKNQCVAMILAQGLFVTGVVQAKEITVLCGIIAGVTHLLFLAVFAWMLNQGIYILLQLGIRRLAHVRVKRWQYSLIGWGFPSAIVGITLAVDYQLYLDGNYCWLATVRGGPYAFIGPVLAVLMINLGIFFYAISRFTSVKAFKNKSEKDKIRSTLRAVSVLCPILGITWGLGLFVRVHISLEYSFTILNSSQGVLLFIFQVLLNEEVYIGARRRLRRHIIYPVVTTEASATENKSITKPTISTMQGTKSSSDERMDMEVLSLKDE